MKIKFLGTAAAEGIPAPFCECAVCKQAREKGGRHIRSRSQALIDGRILCDFNADTFMHAVNNGLCFARLASVLVTHSHSDHLYPKEILMRTPGYAHHDGPKAITFYGSNAVHKAMLPVLESNGVPVSFADFKTLNEFDTLDIEGYKVSALPATHDPSSGPLFYVIEREGKTLLYGHDTGYYKEEVWDWFKKNALHFDLVSLDCTEADKHIDYDSHGNLERDINIKNRLIDEGLADEKTVFVLNHFSHNGGNVGYDDFVALASRHGFVVSYDSMEIEF